MSLHEFKQKYFKQNKIDSLVSSDITTTLDIASKKIKTGFSQYCQTICPGGDCNKCGFKSGIQIAIEILSKDEENN